MSNTKKAKAREKRLKKAKNIFRNNLSKSFTKGSRISDSFVKYVNKKKRIKKVKQPIVNAQQGMLFEPSPYLKRRDGDK